MYYNFFIRNLSYRSNVILDVPKCQLIIVTLLLHGLTLRTNLHLARDLLNYILYHDDN